MRTPDYVLFALIFKYFIVTNSDYNILIDLHHQFYLYLKHLFERFKYVKNRNIS